MNFKTYLLEHTPEVPDGPPRDDLGGEYTTEDAIRDLRWAIRYPDNYGEFPTEDDWYLIERHLRSSRGRKQGEFATEEVRDRILLVYITYREWRNAK